MNDHIRRTVLLRVCTCMNITYLHMFNFSFIL